MLDAKELLAIKSRLEAAAAILSETADSDILSRALYLLNLPTSLSMEDAQRQLHATELLLDIKNHPVAGTPDNELHPPDTFFSDTIAISHDYEAIVNAVRQLSVAPGYAPAAGVLSESDWMLTKQGKKTTYRQGNDRSIQKALVTSLREYESKFEQCDCEGVEELLIRIAEEILLLD